MKTVLTIGLLAIAVPVCFGCRSGGAPATAPSAAVLDPIDPAELPPPRPEEAMAYLSKELRDKTRLVEVFNDKDMSGALDESGRGKLRSALPRWWRGVEASPLRPPAGLPPFRVTPDMGIRIYPPGSAPARAGAGGGGRALEQQPDAQLLIYKARGITRVQVLDPAAARFVPWVYVIPSTAPMEWVNRLFGGRL